MGLRDSGYKIERKKCDKDDHTVLACMIGVLLTKVEYSEKPTLESILDIVGLRVPQICLKRYLKLSVDCLALELRGDGWRNLCITQ